MYLLLLLPQPNAATASIAAEKPINRLCIPSSIRNQAELNTLGPDPNGNVSPRSRRSVAPIVRHHWARRSINERGRRDDDLVELALSNQLASTVPRSNTGDGHQTLDVVFFDFDEAPAN